MIRQSAYSCSIHGVTIQNNLTVKQITLSIISRFSNTILLRNFSGLKLYCICMFISNIKPKPNLIQFGKQKINPK